VKPEDALPNDIPEDVEPSPEEFRKGGEELHAAHREHVAISALKAGMFGIALATGVLASPTAYAQMAPPAPMVQTEVTPKVSPTPQNESFAPSADPPGPAFFHPQFKWTPQGTVSYDFGTAGPNVYANLFGPSFFGPSFVPASKPLPSQPALAMADRFQDRVLAPSGLDAALDRLPDWFSPSIGLGSVAQDHSGQLLEEPADVLLVLQKDLQNPPQTPRDAEAVRSEAKSYLSELFADMETKLGDPQTAADKVLDELFKLPEHLFVLLGGAILARMGFKKHGKRDGDASAPTAGDSELAAGFLAVNVFRAGLERRNGILLQTGRALRRANKLFASELRGHFGWLNPADFPTIRNPWIATPVPAVNTVSVEDVRSYLNLTAGHYTTEQTEATLATGFYRRTGGKWGFADINKLDDHPSSRS
jgi:hypothetical protein